jgi:hypothetical protein
MLGQRHVRRRQEAPGRWLLAALYGMAYLLWLAIAAMTRQWDHIGLAMTPLPALGLYLWRTRRR